MIHYKLFKSVAELPRSWDELPTQDIFLKTSFLRALEASSPTNISSYFLGVFSSETLVGVAIIQRVEMYLDDVFRRTSNKFFKRCGKFLISRIVKGNALIVGNLMHTGQHGLYFDNKAISKTDFFNAVSESLNELGSVVRQNFGKRIRIIACKDYFEDDPICKEHKFFDMLNLYKAKVQPNMVFEIKKEWNTAEDYITSFNKKYRRRYKTARKKSASIRCVELDLNGVESNSEKLYKLYENVSDNAGVNSFKLNKDHFFHLKKELGDDFKVYGYVLNEKLIGFYTFIKNFNKIETYFLGYDKTLQHQHQMYLNMLFDMASYGIDHNFDEVIFARTAMEIKSSIGARPKDMNIYVKHTNNFIANTVLRLVVKYANPVRDWEERHPFK